MDKKTIRDILLSRIDFRLMMMSKGEADSDDVAVMNEHLVILRDLDLLPCEQYISLRMLIQRANSDSLEVADIVPDFKYISVHF